ncbi:MAG TPA: hypothetical protein VKE94_15245 [Gemmataceae bacterium]|nr:hypothetical protein [Gemmataceae bacterium]
MRFLSVSLALAFAVLVVTSAPADEGSKAKSKKKHRAIHGKVETVNKDADKDSGVIEIIVHHRKKGETGSPEVKHEKFKVTPDTKFEFVQREGKGQVDRKPATFADVKKGEHVAIVPMEGAREVAQRVEILVGKKGSKAAAKKTVEE